MNPRRLAARSIEWEPSADAELHHGAVQQPQKDAEYMAAADQRRKLKKPLAAQEPSEQGFRPGLQGGRKRNQAPASLRVDAAPGLLWLDRLSRITTREFAAN